MYIWESFAQRYLASKGCVAHPNLREELRVCSLAEGARYMKEVYGLSEEVNQIVDEVNEGIFREYREVIEPKPGVPALLYALHEQGIPLAIASVTAVSHLKIALERTGLNHLFSAVVSVDECGCSKDQPDIYHLACKHLGTERSTTWVFEDAHHAMQTAVRAGYPVVAVEDASAVAPLADAMPYVHLCTPILGTHLLEPLQRHPGADCPPGCMHVINPCSTVKSAEADE